MSWTALIPLKVPAQRKSRLASALSSAQRAALAEELYRHVMGCVEQSGVFETVVTFSPAPLPVAASTKLWLQQGTDLNAELARARASLPGPLLVLNADLPLLAPEDLLAFVQAAETAGCALAADRHGTGTNAVALLPGVPFVFAFGPGSLVAHSLCTPRASVVRRPGLACDLDTPADLTHLLAGAQPLPERVHRLMYVARTSRAARRMAHAH